jgi:hypothetical protein
MPPPAFNPRAILEILRKHSVEFIVVGGVGAVLQGVPLTTLDLDIVYAGTAENIQRLLAALQELDAVYRDLAGRRIVPTASSLSALGHNLLTTNGGALDVLGYVGTPDAPRRYADLLSFAVEVPVSADVPVLVVDLPTLIALKQEANREKDRLVLPLLQAALKQRQRQEGDG